MEGGYEWANFHAYDLMEGPRKLRRNLLGTILCVCHLSKLYAFVPVP